MTPAQIKYAKTEKARQARLRYRRSVKGRETLRLYRLTASSRASHWKACRKWMATTSRGRQYHERHLLGLPARAPDGLVQLFKLNKALKQEIRK